MAVKRTASGTRKPVKRARMPSKKLQAQVRQLMRMRQEKKFAEQAVTGVVGQVAVNAVGALSSLILPQVPQGDGEGQRIGNSITATGLVWKQQFIKQVGGIGPRRVRTHIVRAADPGVSTSGVISAVLDVNPLSGVRDYFSGLNYAMMADKRITIIGTAETKLMSNYDDNMAGINERSTGDLTIPIKFGDQTIRYEADGDTYPSSVRYFALTLCDNGNSGASTSSASVFVTTASSGVESKGYCRLWYTDS